MTENVMRKVELFASNKNLIHKKFVWDYHLMSVLSSMVYTMENKEADIDAMKNSLKVLKKNTGVFSPFRSSERLFLVSKMALSADPEKYIKDVVALYGKIKKGRIMDDGFMIVAAVNIVDAGRQADADKIIVKFNEIMKAMKKEHPVLTGREDMPLAISLAMTDRSVEDIAAELEENYKILKTVFKGNSDSVQGLAEVLTLQEGASADKAGKVIDIYNAFKANHRKYSREYGLASLGALIGSDKDSDTLVKEICEVERYLASQKGMGMSIMGKSDRLMFAALLVADSEGYAGAGIKNPIIVETLQTIIAMEVMLIVVATSAAASSSR